MQRFLAFAFALFRRIARTEPARVIGAVASVLSEAAAFLITHHVTTWPAAFALVPVFAAELIRQFVTPANSALIRYLPTPKADTSLIDGFLKSSYIPTPAVEPQPTHPDGAPIPTPESPTAPPTTPQPPAS